MLRSSAAGKVLDGGCGDASSSIWLARRGCTMLGIDSRLPFPRGEEISIDDVAPGSLRLLTCDLLEFETLQPFDAVVLMGVLHSLGSRARVEQLIVKVGRWLRPGGIAAISWITDAIPLVDREGYLPSEDLVVEGLLRIGFAKHRLWRAAVRHSHGGPVHDHVIAYSTWTFKAASASCGDSRRGTSGD